MYFQTKGEEDGNEELLFNGCRVSVWKDEGVLETNGGDDCTKCDCT